MGAEVVKMNDLIMHGFSLPHEYEKYMINKLEKNGLSQEAAMEITQKFNFQKEIIISANKAYKQTRPFLNFCQEEGLSTMLPSIFDFHGTLYQHQEEAIHSILQDTCTVISTGTGSGKTESFLIPVFDYCLKHQETGIKAIIIYPMNALAQDQMRRIDMIAERLENSQDKLIRPITFGIYTGNTKYRKDMTVSERWKNQRELCSREDIVEQKPDILITNNGMLDYILTDTNRRTMLDGGKHTIKYIILDEMHTYNGTKGADIKYLLLRLREWTRQDVVQIGCSATLSHRTSRGQESICTDKTINYGSSYAKALFSVNQCALIEPVYEPWLAIQGKKRWPNEDEKRATHILGPYLYNGCATISECLTELEKAGIHGRFQIYLQHIMELNHTMIQPVLDFRVHLFLLNIYGTLKRCIHCGQYHIGTFEHCDFCGGMVFPVYDMDYKQCLGRVWEDEKHHKYLIPDLVMTDQTKHKSVYVCIHMGKEHAQTDYLRFSASYEKNGLLLQYDPEGDIKLSYLAKEHHMEYHQISLGKQNDNKAVYQVYKNSLLHVPKEERRILSFVDNREKAGRIAAVFNDYFLSDFFRECLILAHQQHPKYDIQETYKAVKEKLHVLFPQDTWNENTQSIQREFKVWFVRQISIPENKLGQYSLPLTLLEGIMPEEDSGKEIIRHMLRERAIDRVPWQGKGEIIQFHTAYGEYCRAISLDTHTTAGYDSNSDFETKQYDIIHWGKKGVHQKKSEQQQLQLKNNIEKLIAQGIILKKQNHSQSIYVLNAHKVTFATGRSIYYDFKDIRKDELFFAVSHTSDIPAEQRRRYEKDFMAGRLQTIIATPTLEMGIDIGGLSMVYMIGVPPLPSNYTQRAGRAGRRN
jgi:superfamily II DNA/RNA helicase